MEVRNPKFKPAAASVKRPPVGTLIAVALDACEFTDGVQHVGAGDYKVAW